MESADELVKTLPLHRRLLALGQHWGSIVLDQLYPPVCLVCGEPTLSHNTLCAQCFVQLRPITEPRCPVLGLPFAASIGVDSLSAAAIAEPPPFQRARAAVIYNDLAALLVSRLKYGDRPELALFCGRLMAAAGHEFWHDRPILVPIPLHRSRHFQRRYNQSAELAKVVSAITGLRIDDGLLTRVKRTRQQVGLSADGRARNMVGAFSGHNEGLTRTGGHRVVLIDDVYTTGSTVKAATRALHRCGVKQIDVLSFARVVFGEQMPI